MRTLAIHTLAIHMHAWVYALTHSREWQHSWGSSRLDEGLEPCRHAVDGAPRREQRWQLRLQRLQLASRCGRARLGQLQVALLLGHERGPCQLPAWQPHDGDAAPLPPMPVGRGDSLHRERDKD